MEPKKAEFARLFDLFERLTNRAARKGHAVPVLPQNDRKTSVEPVHRDIHDPSSVAPIREAQQPDTKPISFSTIWPRSTAVGMMAGDATAEASMDNFPIGKSYPFTFKMMFHRLYELEEWAKKVKDVLERSQKDFKPLSEMDWKKKKSQVTIAEDLNIKQPEGQGRSTPIFKESAGPRTRNSPAPRDSIPSERAQDRSVSARATLGSSKFKSPSGPEANTWVYNAAAALMDRGGNTGESTKKGSLASFQLSKTNTADDDDDGRNLLGVTNTPRPVTRINARWVFSETDIASPVSSRKRPYLFG